MPKVPKAKAVTAAKAGNNRKQIAVGTPDSKSKDKSGTPSSSRFVYVSGIIGAIVIAIVYKVYVQNESIQNVSVKQRDIATSNIPKGANAEGKPREADRDCKDRYVKECKQYFQQGECERNPGWMIMNCPSSCNVCRLRDPKLRCDRRALNISTDPIYKPGDMNAMFEALLLDYQHLGVEVLSSPHMQQGRPWIVTIDNFLTDDEVDALISTNNKFERSTDTGQMNGFGETGRVLSQTRTSSNSWCRDDCLAHPAVQRTMNKIKAVTGVPTDNYENFQILKYEVGQRYGVHHDYGLNDRKLACGPRILTFFLYLSDVEEGGHTNFPGLNISVKPSKGKGLLWPSTLDADPERQDPSTIHEAMPVVKGMKFAANSWIHMYSYRVPNLWGCTGTFDDLD